MVKYLDEHQLDFDDNRRNRRLTQKDQMHSGQQEFMSTEYQLAAVHRAAHLLISIGFGTEVEEGGKRGDEKRNKKKKTANANDNSRMVEEILFQGKEFGLGVLRTLICIQTGWPTGVRTDKGISSLEAWLHFYFYSWKRLFLYHSSLTLTHTFFYSRFSFTN